MLQEVGISGCEELLYPFQALFLNFVDVVFRHPVRLEVDSKIYCSD